MRAQLLTEEAPVFEEFGGIPMHPLLLHAAVVFVPLLAVGAIAYGFVPFARRHIRWVVAGLAVAAPGAALFAKLSGDAAFERGRAKKWITDGFIPTIEQHESYGESTAIWAFVLGVLTLVLVYAVAPRAAAVAGATGAGAAATGGGPAWRANPIVGYALAGVVTVVGLITMYYVYKTGDTGAKAVWGGR